MHTRKPPRSTIPNRHHCSRREWFAALSAGPLLASAANAATQLGKPLRGAFMILATPYTADKAIDYEDLAATTVSRRGNYTFPPQAVAQIEHDFEALKPYLRT